MELSPIQRKIEAADVQPEHLAGNERLSKAEKIGEASRQFEAVLLRQILENTQKTVIKSKYTSDSASSAIYRDQITSQLAQSISKSGSFGLAKTFEQQLIRPADRAADLQSAEGKPDGRFSAAVLPTTSRQHDVNALLLRFHTIGRGKIRKRRNGEMATRPRGRILI